MTVNVHVAPFVCKACRLIVPVAGADIESISAAVLDAFVRKGFRERAGDNPFHSLWCGACHDEYRTAFVRDPSISPIDFQQAKRAKLRDDGQPPVTSN